MKTEAAKTTPHEVPKKGNSTLEENLGDHEEHPKDEELEKSPLMTDAQIEELGRLDCDELVITVNSTRNTAKVERNGV